MDKFFFHLFVVDEEEEEDEYRLQANRKRCEMIDSEVSLAV